MTNIQLLKYIKYVKRYNYTTASSEIQKQILYLADQNYLDFEITMKNGEPHYMYSITPAGREYIHLSNKSDKRWRITTFIAILAAIGAYRSELVSIGQAIVKLWISLMGN